MKNPDQQDIKSKNVNAKITVSKIYTKIFGITVQGLPEHFAAANWNPKIDIKTGPRYIHLDGNRFEVILTVQLNGQQNDNPVFESHIEQAGVFVLEDVLEESKEGILYGNCTNYLFPYINVNLNFLLTQSGLPPVYLAPLNFVNLYKEHQMQQKNETVNA